MLIESQPPADDAGQASDRIPLRLIAAQGGLGIELYEAVLVGPLSVRELTWSLPGVQFPVDLSGGVRSFRNRRGELARALLVTDTERLSHWLYPRVRHVLGGLREKPWVWIVDGGIGVGLWGKQGAVAFDLLWAPTPVGFRWVLHNPRGAGFAGPPVAQALAVVDAAVGKVAERRGRLVQFPSAILQLTRAFLPDVGVRIPSSRSLVPGVVTNLGDELSVECLRDAEPAEQSPALAAALGLAQLTTEGDERLLAGQPEAARQAYLAALEQAPRHPELCQLIASIDLAYAERTEAALGLLVESLPVTSFGWVGAELLARQQDWDGAELSLSKQIVNEPFAPLAAWLWVQFAALGSDPVHRHGALDRALAVSPRSPEARWARFTLRLDTSDANGAVADAEHLEAAAHGTRARHEVLVRAAGKLQQAGFVSHAGRLFQRALRYLPNDGRAALGLAESLVASGNIQRAFPLLERAAKDDDPAITSRASLTLGKLIASANEDLPQAISLVQRVDASSRADAIEARALEAAWRARLGDLTGAAQAYGRLADAISVAHRPDGHSAARWLIEGGHFLLDTLGDVRGAERLIGLALRIHSKSPEVRAAYRGVAAKLVLATRSEDPAEDQPPDDV